MASNATAHGAAVVGNKLNVHLVPNTLPCGVRRDAEQVLCGGGDFVLAEVLAEQSFTTLQVLYNCTSPLSG